MSIAYLRHGAVGSPTTHHHEQDADDAVSEAGLHCSYVDPEGKPRQDDDGDGRDVELQDEEARVSGQNETYLQTRKRTYTTEVRL